MYGSRELYITHLHHPLEFQLDVMYRRARWLESRNSQLEEQVLNLQSRIEQLIRVPIHPMPRDISDENIDFAFRRMGYVQYDIPISPIANPLTGSSPWIELARQSFNPPPNSEQEQEDC